MNDASIRTNYLFESGIQITLVTSSAVLAKVGVTQFNFDCFLARICKHVHMYIPK